MIFFIVSIRSIYGICERERAGMPGTTKTGPYNTSHIVWALGESFFILFNTNNFYIVSKNLFTEYAKGRGLECPE